MCINPEAEFMSLELLLFKFLAKLDTIGPLGGSKFFYDLTLFVTVSLFIYPLKFVLISEKVVPCLFLSNELLSSKSSLKEKRFFF